MKHNKVFNPFSSDVISKIEGALATEKKSGKPLYAAFDADGTLWDTDLGENFFHYKISHKVLSGLPADPFAHYDRWKLENGDPRPAYLWLAQICNGHSLKTVREWAANAVNAISPLPVFPAQNDLIRWLLKEKVNVFIVTASVKWAVEPAADLFGLTPDHVIGVETAVENGIVSEKAAGHMTYREGKAKALLARSGGVHPFLCAGNTMGDSYLLESATHIRLAVTGASVDNAEVYGAEQTLQAHAKEKVWITHRF